MEGVVAKKANSVYKSKRSADWLKMKADPEADFAVCGYTPPKGTRQGLGALHLCVRVESQWVWAGKVGSGFDDKLLKQLTAELSKKPRWKPTFPRPEASGDALWIEPELVVQVRYREWPEDSSLRFPVFERLRRDKSPHDCTMPARRTGEPKESREPKPGESLELVVDSQTRELRLSNPKKVFWKDENITKGDLIDYYRSVAPYVVRPVAGAPVSMPLVWDEVMPELDPKQFHVRNALERISSRPDPISPVLEMRPDLAAALTALEKYAKDT
jgi:bifunctional non-homologous end joining protein LigD